jgi:polar amino acid transport system substrate-binding protein
MLKKCLLWGLLLLSPLAGMAQTWKITSLDWPPFSGENLPEGGAGIAVLRAALKAEGIDLQVEFYPWTRAIVTSKRDASYAGFFPAWPEDVPAEYTPSVALFESPVGLVEPVAKPIRWNKLEDLSGKSIGTVQDYGNTPEFMALISSGAISTQIAMNDLTNVRKVAAGRMDAAFIDLNNLGYFLQHDAKDIAHKVQANKKIIENKQLLLAINNKFSERRAPAILKSGVAKINPDKIIKDYMDKYMR